MNSWTNLVESVNKIASDDIILDYNESKAEALRSLILIEDSVKRGDKRNGIKWAKAINVSTNFQKNSTVNAK